MDWSKTFQDNRTLYSQKSYMYQALTVLARKLRHNIDSKGKIKNVIFDCTIYLMDKSANFQQG